MKTLKKVFAIVGTSVLLGGFLMYFIFAIVPAAEALSQYGVAVETYQKMHADNIAKGYQSMMAGPILTMIFGMLGAAAAITFGIIFLVKYARRTFSNPQRQLVFGLLFKQIFAFTLILVCIFTLVGTGICNAAYKDMGNDTKLKVEAIVIVEMVFWILALGAVITGEILHRYHRFAAKITLGSGVGVFAVSAILMMCHKNIHALGIVSGVFLIIGFGLFSAYYILPEPRPGMANQPRPQKVYDEYGYEVRPTQPRPQTAPRPVNKFDDIPIEEEPVRPAPRPVQEQPAPQPKPQPAPQQKPAAPVNNGGVDVTKELQKLKGLLDAGVITKEEYDAKRQKYIDML